jgi:hypothetical protein
MGCLAWIFGVFVVVLLWAGFSLGASLLIVVCNGVPLLVVLFVLSFICNLFNGK